MWFTIIPVACVIAAAASAYAYRTRPRRIRYLPSHRPYADAAMGGLRRKVGSSSEENVVLDPYRMPLPPPSPGGRVVSGPD